MILTNIGYCRKQKGARRDMANKSQAPEDMTTTAILKSRLMAGISSLFQKHWFRRLITLLLAFCIGLGVGAYRCYNYLKEKQAPQEPTTSVVVTPAPTEEPVVLTISHVEEIITPASDLITTKYSYTDADTYENHKELFSVKMPFTTNEVVFTYSGTVGLGIDMSKLSTYVDNESKTITIVLPKLEVKYNEIDADSFEYFNVSTSIFNQLKMEDSTNLIADLLVEKEKQVCNDKSVMDGALENTKLVLKSLLSTSELTEDYRVIFK